MARRLLLGLIVNCLLATACAATPSILPIESAAAPQAAVGSDPADSPSQEVAAEAASGVRRDQAITQLTELAFLSFSDAACVVDALYEVAGTYDFNSPAANAQTDQAELMATCTAGHVPADDEPDHGAAESVGEAGLQIVSVEPDAEDDSIAAADAAADESPASSLSADGAEDDTTVGVASEESVEAADSESGPSDTATAAEEVVSPQSPSLVAGGITTGSVEIADVDLGYVVITPNGFTVGAAAPVLIALPDDRDSLSATRDLTHDFFASVALANGWVVISPSLPDRAWVDPQSAALVSEFTQWVGTWVALEGGRPHLGGFGGGGTGAFAIAAQNPSAFRSLMIYPGLPPEPLEPAAERLAQVPVRMWVVNNEGNRWIGALLRAETAIRANGGNIELHAISLEDAVRLADDGAFGRMIFNELQTLR